MRWQFFEKTTDEERKTKAVEEPTTIRCPLCGKKFSPREAPPCAACGLAEKCGLVMCPNCSYEFAV